MPHDIARYCAEVAADPVLERRLALDSCPSMICDDEELLLLGDACRPP